MAQRTPILLVDDDAKNLLVLETILDAPDYQIIKASNADQTLMALMQQDCAAIVMDVRMPDMSGIELAQLIKKRRKTQHIPILFLTAHHDDEENVMLGYDVGAVDYITKPVNPAILRSKVGVFVDLFRKTADLARLNVAMEGEIQERNANERAQRIIAEAARAEAEAANRAKDRFLAMLSHELRTPLSPVLHAVALLEEEETPPAVQELVATIRRNVQLEARLIDDLLDLARIRSGKLQLHLENADVHDLLRRAAQICEPDIRKQNLELLLDLKATRLKLNVDPARILQIFWNLINNAIKYTSGGGLITLKTRDETERGLVVIEVADSGIGIHPDRIDKIFDAFEQAHGDQSIGLGLGLAISRVLVEMHGGRIEVESPGPGRGSLFAVFLPAVEGEVERTRRDLPLDHKAPVSLRILLTEDHFDTASNLKRLLVRRGHEVDVASTVAEARALIGRKPFDILLSDIGLPDGKGLDLMQPFLNASAGRSVAGIALSGYGMPEDVRRSMDAGFSHHLTKPVEFARLHRELLAISARISGQNTAGQETGAVSSLPG
ncbi:MAG TPA: response regulator [Verrucomicrobiales bacterium]|nr:response regulator [Verrucomicrobiales bacterium]